LTDLSRGCWVTRNDDRKRQMHSYIAAALSVAVLVGAGGARADETLAPRDVPAKSIPVPLNVSPQIQSLIAAPLRPGWNLLPKNADEWRSAATAGAEATMRVLPGIRERLHVAVKDTTIAGVHAFVVTPETVAPENRDRVLVHVHGGCYVLGPGEAGTAEAVLMAGFGHFNVISVDYRMPPDAYFPAALDDAMAVWKATAAQHDPKKMGIFGSSAGGALTLEMVLRAKQEGLPLPAAIAPGTPMADTTKVGDTFQTNALVDNVLVSPDGICDAATRFYANGHSLADPLLSPIYGDMAGFPPAILTSGTRDLLLSNTVRVHRKLREAGVEASLQVYDGQSHAQYGRDDRAPETREAFEEIAAFFDRHLAK
jgi:acetyl esterase/lipase